MICSCGCITDLHQVTGTMLVSLSELLGPLVLLLHVPLLLAGLPVAQGPRHVDLLVVSISIVQVVVWPGLQHLFGWTLQPMEWKVLVKAFIGRVLLDIFQVLLVGVVLCDRES